MKSLTKKILPIMIVALLIIGCVAPVVVLADTSVSVHVTVTGIKGLVRISGKEDPEDGTGEPAIVVDPEGDQDKTQTITFHNNFTKYYISVEPDFFTGGKITSIKIDGDSKTISKPTGRNTYEVSPASTYNVEVVGVQEQHYNIMWANDGAKVKGTDFDNPEILLQNGSAIVKKVYDNETDMNDISDEIEHIEEGCVDPDGKGYVSLAEGNVVIFEFTPKYGYQLTSVSANGGKLEPQEDMNQYMYIMPGTNVHFQATFTKTNDVVKSETTKVTSGTVKIGANEINAGSTVLSVKDATLTEEQKTTFSTKAGDYKVSNVFDIKLDQVFYKGSTDSSDVWSKPLGYSEDLQTPATITLKLDEGVDGNTVILIHEKEDGTYETIETTYDEATHTISFSTKSFSNYAIASKTVDNPNTGDNSMTWLIMLLISFVGIVGVVAFRKIKNN